MRVSFEGIVGHRIESFRKKWMLDVLKVRKADLHAVKVSCLEKAPQMANEAFLLKQFLQG